MAIDYFLEDELRALPQMSDTTTYPTARVEAAAAYITAIVERVTGTSFIARTVTGEVHNGGCYEIVLRKPNVISVTSATEGGTTVTDTLRVADGILRRFSATTSYYPMYWAAGINNIAVTYQAGYSSIPPADIKEATLKGTRAYLLSTNSSADYSDRRTSLSTEQGTISYVIAGEDRPTGYPEVDAVIMGWAKQFSGFA